MSRRPIRIATTPQLERSCRVAGFETYLLPDLPSLDLNRSLQERSSDGEIYRPFLEKHDIELVLDFNAAALTLVPSSSQPEQMSLTTAALGIPYVAAYLDPVTSVMAQVGWADHWHLLESNTWIKWIPERIHAEELMQLGIGNVITMPMAAADEDYDTDPLPDPDPGPVIAFMGHPASSWFASEQPILPRELFAGLTAAAVRADMPDVPFHRIYHELYQFAEPPKPTDDRLTRAKKSGEFFAQKFIYHAYLAIKHRDRFARFLKQKLGDSFELVGDFWETHYGLKHTPRIWDMKLLHQRMRRVPICLNLVKGNWEAALIIRHFETTAHGAFTLSYEMGELSDSFEIGKECAVFHDEAELLEKIDYYLARPDERREIAAAGQRRTLSEHLYSHRITTLVELLRKGNVLPKKVSTAEAAPVTAPATATVSKIHIKGVADEPVRIKMPAPN